MIERLSREDETLLYGYEIHAQRYRFAARYCHDRTVLDAGCGIGYGSGLLARSGARQVTGIDVSAEALAQAVKYYQRDGVVWFLRADLETLGETAGVPKNVEVVVNLENIEHLQHPDRFLCQLDHVLAPSGTFVTSTPNGLLTELDAQGHNINNPFHLKEFTREELAKLLALHFGKVELFGQWETNDCRLRQAEARAAFERDLDAYFNPAAKLGRLVRRVFRKPVSGPPEYGSAGASYSWDHVIESLDGPWPFEWQPSVLLAVCRH
jgi:2-polyprenyl-3-methyl-5-hydroxy-6-metoxy-1,4-benzoquinol methylase